MYRRVYRKLFVLPTDIHIQLPFIIGIWVFQHLFLFVYYYVFAFDWGGSLGYFPFQPVVHNWFIKGRGMYCSVYGKVHIKDPLLLIEKSSLCGGSGFPSIKCVNVTI